MATMPRPRRWTCGSAVVAAFAVLMMLSLPGCPPADEDPAVQELDTDPGGSSPDHAIRKVLLGMAEGRGDVVGSAIDQSTPEGEAFAEFLQQMAMLSGEVRELERAAADKFGDEGLAVLEEELEMDAGVEPEQIDRMEIEIEGDYAVAEIPGEGPLDESIHLMRGEDGRWYVLPPAEIEAAEEMRMIMEMIVSSMQQQIQAAQLAVEEADSLEQLRELLAAARPAFPLEPEQLPEDFGPLPD